jgi:hypothetical protein
MTQYPPDNLTTEELEQWYHSERLRVFGVKDIELPPNDGNGDLCFGKSSSQTQKLPVKGKRLTASELNYLRNK